MQMFHRCIFCMYGICMHLSNLFAFTLFVNLFITSGPPGASQRPPTSHCGWRASPQPRHKSLSHVGKLEFFETPGRFSNLVVVVNGINRLDSPGVKRLLEKYLILDVFKEPSEPIMHLQPIDQHLTNYIQGLVAFWLQEKWFVGSLIWSRRLILPASFPSSSVALFSCWSTKGHSPAGSRSENMVQHCLCCTSNWGYDGIPIYPSRLNQQVGLTHLCSSCQRWLKSTACCNPDKRVIRISKFFKL